ncbi:amino acid transporter [Amniculicola lignicola CBS 123094]|uniref:Amino acid transporter n=1 Tax=Amniculicola lignicola CBS 123094 TaxID=1392246 RepID=A0A6A5W2L8_9PLEO|nr:amino acid transporter [Amniculicola lignicola CBS 123094]
MDKTVELRTLDDEIFHQRRNNGSVGDEKYTDFDCDKYELARAGKRSQLKRRFGLVSMTGLSCGLMCTWESLLVLFMIGLSNGGPAGIIYGFIFVWLGNLSVFIAVGELSSAIPTAGGQYHWVSLLAPRSSKKFFSYITGWLTVIGWVAALTAVCGFVSDLTLALVVDNHVDFHRSGWHGTLLLWASLLLCVVINIFISGALPSIEVVVLIIHILGFFGILIPLVYLSPTHNSVKTVFTAFNNRNGWDSKGLVFFIGLQGSALAFVGTDSAVHMSEEVKNASRDVPRSMIISLIINGFLALGMLLAVLFSAAGIDDPEKVWDPVAFIQVFTEAVGSNAGGAVMTSIVIVLEFCSALGCLAAASRMMWSFARDRGLPFSRFISMIHPRTTIPVVAILLVTLSSALLGLINIGSNAAFNGIVSMVLQGFYISYILALALFLWRRLRGDIHEPRSNMMTSFHSDPTDVDAEVEISWGPWRLKGALGVANNVFACSYLLILGFISFWPTAPSVQGGKTMNWAVLVVGSVVLFSIGYYVIYAKKSYKGPIVEVDLHTL